MSLGMTIRNSKKFIRKNDIIRKNFVKCLLLTLKKKITALGDSHVRCVSKLFEKVGDRF